VLEKTNSMRSTVIDIWQDFSSKIPCTLFCTQQRNAKISKRVICRFLNFASLHLTHLRCLKDWNTFVIRPRVYESKLEHLYNNCYISKNGFAWLVYSLACLWFLSYHFWQKKNSWDKSKRRSPAESLEKQQHNQWFCPQDSVWNPRTSIFLNYGLNWNAG